MYVSNTYITYHFQKKKNTRKKKNHPENKPDTQRHTRTKKSIPNNYEWSSRINKLEYNATM